MARRFNQFALVAAPVGTAGAVVDDPVVKTASFTAKQGVRYFIHTGFLPFTMTLPSSPTEGMTVGVTSAGVGGAGVLTITAPGSTVSVRGNAGSSITVGAYNMNLLFRYWSVVSAWIEIGAGLASFEDQVNTYPAIFIRGVGFNGLPDTLLLPTNDGIPGRVENSAIQELRPWMVAHNLYNLLSGTVVNTNTGVQAAWLASTAGYRSDFVSWQGASDLIVRGMDAAPTSTDFRHDKVILNNTGVAGTSANKNIIWKKMDGGVVSGRRIYHDGATPSTDYADYVQGPDTTVLLRYNSQLSLWFITPMVPSGRIDRGVTTTDAVATIIHSHQTNLNNRVIAYKVQIEALETALTPGNSALYDIVALFHRDNLGTVVNKGVTFVGMIEDVAAWDVTFTIGSGTIIEMRVTGDAGDTVRWRVVGTITEHG